MEKVFKIIKVILTVLFAVGALFFVMAFVAITDFAAKIICSVFAVTFIIGIIILNIKFKGGLKMSFLDNFKCKQYKTELEQLQREHEQLLSLLTPEMQNAFTLQQKTAELNLQYSELVNSISLKNQELNSITQEIAAKKADIIWLDEAIQIQEFGLYEPQFDLASSLDYKEELARIRKRQKDLIKENRAVTGNTGWSVNGNFAQGKKMVTDTQKLLLRAFNNECDDLVAKVKYTNFDASLNKMYKSSEAISKLGTIMSISITQIYLDAKVKELRLAFEYQMKKQQEKEELQAARAEQREQAKVERELAEERKKLDKEQTHYQTAYEKIQKQLEMDPDNTELQRKEKEISRHLNDVEHALEDVDYRSANIKAGYVYIISNIGAFGNNVYKIGMTRRLEPMDRIDELGSASVPFNFDVHAMIFSDDAPALEAALHRAFEDRKLNMVNQRREFFHVTLDEIKAVVKNNFDQTVEFNDIPNAEQFRVSQKMRGESATPESRLASHTTHAPTKSNEQFNAITLEGIINYFKDSDLFFTKNGNYYEFREKGTENILFKYGIYKHKPHIFIKMLRYPIKTLNDLKNIPFS